LHRRANHGHTFIIARIKPAPETGRGLFQSDSDQHFTEPVAARIRPNKEEAQPLTGQMLLFEAVIKMLDPTYNLQPTSVKGRKPNPWLERGTVYRRAVHVLRTATEPMTALDIAERVLAAANIK
jgi:hypothetical protein